MADLFFYVGLFLASVLIAYATSRAANRSDSRFPIEPDSLVEILAPGGKLRCRFVREETASLVFALPLQRRGISPVEGDDSIQILAPCDGRLAAFRVKVLSRDPDSQEIHVDKPHAIKYMDRRREVRNRLIAGEIAAVNGTAAVLVDLSDWGALVECHADVAPGESVRFELPERRMCLDAWVMRAGDRHVSVMFAERLPLPA